MATGHGLDFGPEDGGALPAMRALVLLAALSLAAPAAAGAQALSGCTIVPLGNGRATIYCPPETGRTPTPTEPRGLHCEGTRVGPSGFCVPDLRRGPTRPGARSDDLLWLRLYLESLRQDP